MSWYQIYKFSTFISDIDTFPERTGSYRELENFIEILHELEIKSFTVSQFQDYVQIFPARKRNIMKRLREIGWRYFELCRDEILEVFEEWKKNHQIFDKEEWAIRLYEYYEEVYGDNYVQEIMKNGISIGNPSLGIQITSDDIIEYINEEDIKYVISNMFYSDYEAYEYQIEYFIEENYKEEYEKSKETPIEFMQSHNLEEEVLKYILDNTDFSTFIQDYEYYDLIDRDTIIKAIQEKLYPRYMNVFGSAIEEVWENIEKAEERLNSVTENDSLSTMTMAVSLALNVMHVHGNIMQDYGYGIRKNFLDELGKGRKVKQWENEAIEEFLRGKTSF